MGEEKATKEEETTKDAPVQLLSEEPDKDTKGDKATEDKEAAKETKTAKKEEKKAEEASKKDKEATKEEKAKKEEETTKDALVQLLSEEPDKDTKGDKAAEDKE